VARRFRRIQARRLGKTGEGAGQLASGTFELRLGVELLGKGREPLAAPGAADLGARGEIGDPSLGERDQLRHICHVALRGQKGVEALGHAGIDPQAGVVRIQRFGALQPAPCAHLSPFPEAVKDWLYEVQA